MNAGSMHPSPVSFGGQVRKPRWSEVVAEFMQFPSFFAMSVLLTIVR
jgi:hypothetical protein